MCVCMRVPVCVCLSVPTWAFTHVYGNIWDSQDLLHIKFDSLNARCMYVCVKESLYVRTCTCVCANFDFTKRQVCVCAYVCVRAFVCASVPNLTLQTSGMCVCICVYVCVGVCGCAEFDFTNGRYVIYSFFYIYKKIYI